MVDLAESARDQRLLRQIDLDVGHVAQLGRHDGECIGERAVEIGRTALAAVGVTELLHRTHQPRHALSDRIEGARQRFIDVLEIGPGFGLAHF